jgi:hypothetical protein
LSNLSTSSPQSTTNNPQSKTAFSFDPDQVAHYEKTGWEAYYDRNWLRAFWLLMRLNHAQFRMTWPVAFSGAIDTVRASAAFAPLEHNDVPKAQYYITRFYQKAARSLGLRTAPAALAKLEIDYWVVHRQLARARAQDPVAGDIGPMTESLARLHAVLFGSTPERMRTSAELRARAAEVVDLITSRRSTEVLADWRRVEDYLRQAYRAVLKDA